MRTALQIDILDTRLFGTLHGRNGTDSSYSEKPGILLLSFGQQPRSWIGDLGSSIADRIVEEGFPVFRFDMPGLGDSPGPLPEHLEVLFRDIQLGSHYPYLEALCINLQKEFNLPGLIIGGFCGGAVSALYSVLSKDFIPAGLILLEPEIGITSTGDSIQGKTPELNIHSYLTRKNNLRHKIFSPKAWKKLITGHADFSFWKSFLDFSFKRFFKRMAKPQELPPETNRKLLDAWKTARAGKVPTLVISIGSPKRRTYYKSYGLEPGISCNKACLSWEEIPNTTHALLEGGAKNRVGEIALDWVASNF